MAAFTSNPFALLGDDNDGDAPAAPKAAPKAPAAGSIPAAAQRNVPGQQAPRRPKSDYPARGAPRGGFRGGEQRGAPAAGGEEGFSAVNGRDDRAERTRGTARGGPRGQGRGGRGGPGARGARAPRPDRHSQTGQHDSEKKEHQGWGGDEGKRELEAEVEGEKDAAGEAKAGDGWDSAPADGEKKAEDGWASKEGDAKAADGKANGAPAPVEEEEDNTLTYDEYLAQQAAGVSIGGIESRSARQANAGADDSQWKHAVEVARKADQAEESYFAASKTKKQQRERAEKAGKQYIEIEPHFAPPERSGRGGERGGRGRGARGGDRGERRGGNRGAGRGAPRGGARSQTADINPDDKNAFPSLS